MGAYVRKDFSSTYNSCGHNCSATANTIFDKVKFSLRKAFSYAIKLHQHQEPIGK